MNQNSVCRILKLSHRGIDSLSAPPDDWPSSNIEYTAAQEPNLKLVIFKQGANKARPPHKSWRLRYSFRGKKCTLTIGHYPSLSLEKALEIARNHKALISQGIDPRELREKTLTVCNFEEFVMNDFLPRATKSRKGIKDVKSRLDCHLLPTFRNRPLPSINKREISIWHSQLEDRISATTANRSLSLLSAILREAQDLELISVNPARGIRKAKESGPRTRVLSSEEFSRFVTALVKIIDTPQGAAIFLLLALGLQKMEILSLAWPDVDLDGNCVFIRENKVDIPRFVPLNSTAKEVFERLFAKRASTSNWVFPSNSASGHLQEIRRSFKTILNQAGIDSYRTHDLRRQFATNLLNNGVSIYEIKELLGHQDLRSTQIYAKLASNTLRVASETSATILELEMAKAS